MCRSFQVSPSWSFLAGFTLVLVLSWLINSTGCMRPFLNHTEVAQVAQLLQDGTSTRAAARRFNVTPSTNSNSRRAGRGRRRYSTHQKGRYLLLCALQRDLQRASRVNVFTQSGTDFIKVARGALTSCSGPCSHCPAPWRLVGFCSRTTELASHPLAPCTFHRWEQFHPKHLLLTWKRRLEKTRRTLCCLQRRSTWQVWWRVFYGLGKHIHAGTHRPLLPRTWCSDCHTVSKWKPWTHCQTLRWRSSSWFPSNARQWPASCGKSMEAVPGGWRNCNNLKAFTISWLKPNRTSLGHYVWVQ